MVTFTAYGSWVQQTTLPHTTELDTSPKYS
jgi:hypothetical protein